MRASSLPLGLLHLALVACSAADPTVTRGELCTAFWTALCARSQEVCEPSAPAAECISTFVAACCAGSACDLDTGVTRAELAACTLDIGGLSCAELMSAALPTTCSP